MTTRNDDAPGSTRQNRQDDKPGSSSGRAGQGDSSQPDRPLPSSGQVDDNQDDLGRDVNDPGKTSNDINKPDRSGT